MRSEELQKFSVHEENDIRKIPPAWSSHEQAEIQYIVRGSFELCIGDLRHIVGPGDIVVIPPNKLHRIAPLDPRSFSAICILLQADIRKALCGEESDSCVLDFLTQAAQSPVLRLDEVQRTWLAALFRHLVYENAGEEKYRPACMMDLLELIAAEIARQYEGAVAPHRSPPYEPPDISRLIKNIIQYINHNFKEDITLSKIAREFWLNPSYLSRQFKVNVGVNITEFITGRRLEYAKAQLAASDASISEIALNAGFNNISYFNTVFKRRLGVSPRQYRKEQRLSGIPEGEHFSPWEGW